MTVQRMSSVTKSHTGPAPARPWPTNYCRRFETPETAANRKTPKTHPGHPSHLLHSAPIASSHTSRAALAREPLIALSPRSAVLCFCPASQMPHGGSLKTQIHLLASTVLALEECAQRQYPNS